MKQTLISQAMELTKTKHHDYGISERCQGIEGKRGVTPTEALELAAEIGDARLAKKAQRLIDQGRGNDTYTENNRDPLSRLQRDVEGVIRYDYIAQTRGFNNYEEMRKFQNKE